jgi:hypothetical protein
MLGRIGKLWQNEANGKPYLVLEIEGQHYSLWDESWLDKLQEGDTVKYDWKKAGKFRNITSIEQVGTHPQGSGEKDKQIVRMSCLKSAASIFGNVDAEPRKKIDLTIASARRFEKYINDTLPARRSNDSKGQNYDHQYGDDDLQL